jgi:hypothetical protein
MIDEIINLRNRIHKGDFRFVLTPEHWSVLYVPENVEKSNLETVTKDGKLKGYAVFYVMNFDQVRAYDVREIIAEDEKTLTQLLDQISDKGMKDDVDFIFLKRCEEPYARVVNNKGFTAFVESVVMIALLDPQKLLSALSEKVENGKVLRLLINGSDQIDIKVGQKGIMLVNGEKPEFIVSTDSKTFLRLFFGRTSLLSEFLRRRAKLSGIRCLAIARRFFNIIQQSKWYIPMGDWV